MPDPHFPQQRSQRRSEDRSIPWLSRPEAPPRPTRRAQAAARGLEEQPALQLANLRRSWAPRPPGVQVVSLSGEPLVASLEAEVVRLMERLRIIEAAALPAPHVPNRG